MLTHSQIGKVQEAAIRAAMYSAQFQEGSCAEGEFRSAYNLVPRDENGDPYGGFNPVTMIVSYPGGTWYVDNGGQKVPFSSTSWGRDGWSVPFDAAALYQEWRTAISTIFDPWLTIPTEGDFTDSVTTIQGAAKQLNAEGVFTTGDGTELVIQGENEELGSNVAYVDDELAQYNGDMIDTLDRNYVSRISPTIAGQHIVACAAGTVVAGHQEVWRIAGEHIVEIAIAAEESFNGLCERKAADWKTTLKVVGAVLSAAGLFLGPGGVATAVTATRTITGIITTFMPDPPEPKEAALTGSDATEVCASLVDACKALADDIGTSESELMGFGITVDGFIRDNRSSFDISMTRGFLDDDSAEYFKDGENLSVLMPHLREKIAPTFALIGDAQLAAATSMDGAVSESRWYRDPALGLSYRGGYAGYSVLEQSLMSLCSNSRTEMHSIAERLIAASYDFDRTEDQIRTELEKRIRELDEV